MPHPETEIEKQHIKIGGWLLLPALGLILAPFIFMSEAYKEFSEIFGSDATHGMDSIEITIYSVVLLGMLFSFLMYILFTIYSFFKRKKITPKLMVGFYSLGCMAAILYYLSEPNAVGLKGLIPNFATLIIWVPYFLFSKRVKNTFVV